MTDDARLAPEPLADFAAACLRAIGCAPAVAAEVAAHLVEADLMGVHSHGTARLPQYAEQAAAGEFDPSGTATLGTAGPRAMPVADGARGFGIPAMRLATEEAVRRARGDGLGVAGVVNVGHTGRIGAFAEMAAAEGMAAIVLGGGSRREWRQVAPFGGARAMLPTNPYAFAVPGGERGAVVLDFATAAAAGGKVMAAAQAGRALPEGLIVDAEGRPSTDPAAYYAGGALLPAAGPKGYGMALVAELIGEAMLGPAITGMNWIVVLIDTTAWRAPGPYHAAAEACLAELRACPPAPGFDRVEIPGERERALMARRRSEGIPVPAATLDLLRRTGRDLGVALDPAG